MTLEFHNISHAYNGQNALDGINLAIKPGAITCLLGASGCGKTTLLHLAAGLLKTQSGMIISKGSEISSPSLHIPPDKRDVGLVMQEGALFPHLNVKDNLRFGIPAQRRKSVETDMLVTQLLEQIGLSGFEARFPHTLSGGQQQRIAMARALAPNPAVLLMDEPFANIDSVRRRDMRRDIRLWLKSRSVTVLMVTHDPEEALEFADDIAVMHNGKIAQFGSADTLYNTPKSLQVAQLIGGGDLLPATLTSEAIQTPFGTWPLESLAHKPDTTGPICLFLRPQSLYLDKAGETAQVVDVQNLGALVRVTICSRSDTSLQFTLKITSETHVAIGDRIGLRPKPACIHIF